MKVVVHFTDEVGISLQEPFFSQIAETTFSQCPLPSLKKRTSISFNAVAVSKDKIQELNRIYRQKDSVTDILSFGEYADTVAFEQSMEDDVFLGEVFFCYDVIAKAAQEDEVTLDHEMTYVFSHGVLHLMGYDHGDEMFSVQDMVTAAIMQKTKNKNEYEEIVS